MAFTRAQLRGLLYNLGIDLGFQRSATSISAQAIIDAVKFTNTGEAESQFKGATIVLPGESSANQERIADVTAAGTLTHLGLAYAGLTTLAYELLGLGLTFAEINYVMQRMLRMAYVNYYHPLGWQLDNDFSQVLTTGPDWDWTANTVAMTTVAKASTGGVWTQAGQTGPRNLVLTGSGAGNGYVPTSRLNVEPGDSLWWGAIARVNGAYTGSAALYNVTGASVIDTITFDARAFQRLAKQSTIPASCKQVELHIGNVTASGVTEWDCLFGHLLGYEGNDVVLPSYLTQRYQFMGFGPAIYEGRSTGTDRWNATSRRITSWPPGSQGYEPLPQQENASVTTLQINKPGGLTASDFWVYGRRPRSDFETLDNETDTTNIGEDEALELMQYLLFDLLHTKWQDESGRSQWLERRDFWGSQAASRKLSTPPIQPTPVRTYMRIGMRRGG